MCRKSLKKGLRNANWERYHEQMNSDAPELWSVVSQLELRKERAISMESRVLQAVPTSLTFQVGYYRQR